MQPLTLHKYCCITMMSFLLSASVSVVETAAACPCDGDINDNGVFDTRDLDTLLECISGECADCVNSCDVNCDGTIDYVDLGVVHCQYTAGTECCGEPTGSCFLDSYLFPDCVITLAGFCEFHVGTFVVNDTTCGIPTVSQWGLVNLALVLTTAGTLMLRRHRPAAERIHTS